MPSSSANNKDNPAGDMAPFIIFMAFVILTTIIVISIYRLSSEDDAASVPENSGFTITLNAREPIVFSDDFLFPGFFPVSGASNRNGRPDIQLGIIRARRLLNEGEYGDAEDLLRTLFLFYPDDAEVICLLSGVLRAMDRDDEAASLEERLDFPPPVSAMPSQGSDAPEKRTAS